jgi:hypothetical protein
VLVYPSGVDVSTSTLRYLSACLRTRRRAAGIQRPDALYAIAATTTTNTAGKFARLGSSRSSPVAASNLIPGWACTAGSLSRVSPYCTGSAGSASDRKSATTSTKPSSASPAPSSAGDASTTSQTVRSSKAPPEEPEGLTLLSWPGELQRQAKALYRTGRAQRLLDFVAEHPREWLIEPKPHLAFWHAPPDQRLYLTCRLPVTEYAARWSGDDFDQVRSHPYRDIRERLWPWLLERQYADSQDDLELFLRHLGHRPAHLRPTIEVRRVWSWPQADDLNKRGQLIGTVRAAVTELLTALDEPLPLRVPVVRKRAGWLANDDRPTSRPGSAPATSSVTSPSDQHTRPRLRLVARSLPAPLLDTHQRPVRSRP